MGRSYTLCLKQINNNINYSLNSLIRDKRDFLQGLVFGTVGLNLLFGRALLTFIFAGPGIVNSIGLVGLVRSELDGFLHIGLLLVFRLTEYETSSIV